MFVLCIVRNDLSFIECAFYATIQTISSSVMFVLAFLLTDIYIICRKWLVFSSKSPFNNKPLVHTHPAVNHTLRKIMLESVAANQPHNLAVASATGSKKKMRASGKKRKLGGEDEE